MGEIKRIFCGNVILSDNELVERNKRHPMELVYYKTKTIKTNLISQINEVYGVEIVKKEYIGNEIHTESTYVENITKNEEIVDKVMKMLQNNTVTPVGLNDVINDMFKL